MSTVMLWNFIWKFHSKEIMPAHFLQATQIIVYDTA